MVMILYCNFGGWQRCSHCCDRSETINNAETPRGQFKRRPTCFISIQLFAGSMSTIQNSDNHGEDDDVVSDNSGHRQQPDEVQRRRLQRTSEKEQVN